MAQGISEVLTYGIGVSLSLLSIVAVILLLLSPRASVNGPAFLAGWAVALSIMSLIAFLIFRQSDVAAKITTADALSWGRVGLGALLLLLALRAWLSRLAPGAEPEMPKWTASVDTLSPTTALGHGLLMACVDAKNVILTIAVSAALAELGLSRSDAAVSLIVFVIVGSVTIAAPVVYSFVGGQRAAAALDSLKHWLTVHDDAVTIVVLVVLGVDLIAWGLPTLAT